MIAINPIIETIPNQKKYIYGFDCFTREIFVYLVDKGLYVDGFVIDDDYSKPFSSYLNKKIYHFCELSNTQKSIILDLCGSNRDKIEHLGYKVETILLPNVKENVVIYGAGVYGKRYFNYLKKMGIEVECFCDRDDSKVGKDILGKHIISVEELKKKKDANILLGIYPLNIPEVEQYFKDELKISNYYTFKVGDYISLLPEGEKPSIKTVFTTFELAYIFESTKYRDVYILGDKKSIAEVGRKFKFFDMHIKGISVDGFIGELDGVSCISQYDLFYSDGTQIIVHVLEGFEYYANIINKELDNKDIFFVKDMTERIDYEIVLDVNNGYNIKYKGNTGLIRMGNKTGRRIAILGGSTSDAGLYPEKSWPEMLELIISQHEKNAEIFCGGTQGYVISQEMTKFLRDILPLKPDILILYSGLNDAGQISDRYSNYYQNELFEKLVKQSNYDAYYGTPIKDRIVYWFEMVQAIQAICNQFKIKLYVISGPTVYSKKILSDYEKQLILVENDHYFGDTIPREEYLPGIREKIKNSNNDNWYDMSETIIEELHKENLFYFIDPVHFTTDGNAILAKKIYSLIEKEL